MKFSRELDDDLVPEWRIKYLDYKSGKKKVKAVSKALSQVNRTPKIAAGRSSPQGFLESPDAEEAGYTEPLKFTHYDFLQRGKKPIAGNTTQDPVENEAGTPRKGASRPDPGRRESLTMFAKSPPVLAPDSRPDTPEDTPESTPLNIPGRPGETGSWGARYGSIVGTPPHSSPPRQMPSLALPDPAIGGRRKQPQTPQSEAMSPRTLAPGKPPPESPDPYHIGPDSTPKKFGSSLPRHLFRSRRSNSTPYNTGTTPPSKLRRMFSAVNIESPKITNVQMNAYRELDAKQDDFFNYLDKELDKIETFYRAKEEEATHRLHVLREQLHELRDQRMEDMKKIKQGKDVREEGLLSGLLPVTPLPTAPIGDDANRNGRGNGLLKPIGDAVRRKSHVGKTSEAMQKLGSPDHPQGKNKQNEDRSDFTRRHPTNDRVPYRFAKRRLKLALQEFYRGLELLKSYALLNRTGFRKINKKYDKAVNARPTLRYMTEKVNNAYFVQSNVLDGHIVAVEDLYARYFERGNHKIAVGKLRTRLRTGDQSPPSFRNGLWVAGGILFGIQGIVSGANHLFSDDPTIAIQSSYVMQLYAGYFLAVLLFLMFVLNCKVWARAKINYVFIFEYDTRHTLDWRQLAEIPCFFLFLNGLFLWLNFRQDGGDGMYLYWFLALICVSLIIMCMPFPILYHNARKWWGFSNWRLLLAGLYPVEFRDFYLGDMYCSETYAMSQVEIFFCLYVNSWVNPPQCNSNHSRLLGFFTTLPAIWRALQCLRRYYDSRNWFPHLANFAKYCCNILYYMSLSLYRLDINTKNRAIFIVFAIINGIYCSFWDVAMDFSLGNPYAHHPFLRDRLGYRRVWVYYVAMVLDVVLRQQWIFYALFSHDLQHSAVMSFFIGLAEVLRRGMWSLFRVENEHCNNVGKFRASRDIPLPYELPGATEEHGDGYSPKQTRKDSPEEHAIDADATGADVERADTAEADGSLRRRPQSNRTPTATPGIRALQRVGTVIAAAHAQDFEKKKRPDVVGGTPGAEAQRHDDDDDESSDEDENEMNEDLEEAREDQDEVTEAQKMLSQGLG